MLFMLFTTYSTKFQRLVQNATRDFHNLPLKEKKQGNSAMCLFLDTFLP